MARSLLGDRKALCGAGPRVGIERGPIEVEPFQRHWQLEQVTGETLEAGRVLGRGSHPMVGREAGMSDPPGVEEFEALRPEKLFPDLDQRSRSEGQRGVDDAVRSCRPNSKSVIRTDITRFSSTVNAIC